MAENPPSNTRRRLYIRDVEDRYQRSRATIQRWYRKDKFPEPRYWHGLRYWWSDELDAYDAARQKEEEVANAERQAAWLDRQYRRPA